MAAKADFIFGNEVKYFRRQRANEEKNSSEIENDFFFILVSTFFFIVSASGNFLLHKYDASSELYFISHFSENNIR